MLPLLRVSRDKIYTHTCRHKTLRRGGRLSLAGGLGQNLLDGGEGLVLAHADDGLHGGDVVGMAGIVPVTFRDGEEGPVLLHGGHIVPDSLEGPGPDEGDDGQVEPVVVLG